MKKICIFYTLLVFLFNIHTGNAQYSNKLEIYQEIDSLIKAPDKVIEKKRNAIKFIDSIPEYCRGFPVLDKDNKSIKILRKYFTNNYNIYFTHYAKASSKNKNVLIVGVINNDSTKIINFYYFQFGNDWYFFHCQASFINNKYNLYECLFINEIENKDTYDIKCNYLSIDSIIHNTINYKSILDNAKRYPDFRINNDNFYNLNFIVSYLDLLVNKQYRILREKFYSTSDNKLMNHIVTVGINSTFEITFFFVFTDESWFLEDISYISLI